MATTTAPLGSGYRLRQRLQLGLSYFVMLLLAVFFLFPIVFMIVSSLKNSEMQVVADKSNLRAFVPVGDIGIQNYTDVFAQLDFGKLVFNSAFIMLFTVSLGLLINSLIAYALARLRFKGRALILGVIVALIIIVILARRRSRQRLAGWMKRRLPQAAETVHGAVEAGRTLLDPVD